MISADGPFRHPRAASPSGRTIIRLRGALDIEAAPALRERLIDVLHRGTGLLVLDLSHVLSCDASLLAVLIGTQRRARPLGTVVRLVAPSLPVTKVMRSTGLDRSFTIYPDLSSALASELDEPASPAPAPAPAPAVPRPRLGNPVGQRVLVRTGVCGTSVLASAGNGATRGREVRAGLVSGPRIASVTGCGRAGW
jgi:anti-sigma B factor antagonist